MYEPQRVCTSVDHTEQVPLKSKYNTNYILHWLMDVSPKETFMKGARTVEDSQKADGQHSSLIWGIYLAE